MNLRLIYKQFHVVKKWYVRSKTSKRLYLVEKIVDGSFRCECPAYKECHHIKRIKQIEKGE